MTEKKMKTFVLMLALSLPLGSVALAQDAPKTNQVKTEKSCCSQKGKKADACKAGDKKAKTCKSGDKKADACKVTGKKK